MFTQRMGWLSLVAGGVLAVGLSLSSEAWAQKGGPPPKPAKTFNESRSNSLSQKDVSPSTQKLGDPIGGVDVGLGKKPGGVMFTTTTDKNGAFAFPDLESGTYEIVSLSGFPVTAGKTVRYTVIFETGWMVPMDDTGGKTRISTLKDSKSNTSELALPPDDTDVGDPASDTGSGPKEDTGPQLRSKDFNSIKSNTAPIPGKGKDHPTEKFITTISNIKNLAFGVSPDGVGQLTDRPAMEIHAVGSEIMISGPGTGVVESLGANPGDPGYAIKEQGIKRVMPSTVAAPMWLRGRVFVSKATTGSDDPATGVGTPVDDVPAEVIPPKKGRGFKLPKLP